jgi:pyruvate kinase
MVVFDSVISEPLIRKLEALRADLIRLKTDASRLFEGVSATDSSSARNLLHYMALRRHDIRELQDQLTVVGLPSLGRSEACVLAS